MKGRKSINTYIFIEQLQQSKGHDFESQTYINCVTLSKSLKPIKTNFIPPNNNARESTLYSRRHYTHLQCPVQDTASIKLRSKMRKTHNF